MALSIKPDSPREKNTWILWLVLGVGAPVWAVFAALGDGYEGIRVEEPMARLAAAAGSVMGFWLLTREHLRQGVVFVLAVVWSQAAFFTTHIYINWRGNILSNIEMLLPLGAAFLPVLVVWWLFIHTEETR